MDANIEMQSEEIEALCAIYGEEFSVKNERVAGKSPCTVLLKIFVPPLEINFICHLPDLYPLEDAPIVEIKGNGLGEQAISELTGEMLVECPFVPGEVVLFTWAEWLRSKLDEWAEERKQNMAEVEEQGLRLTHASENDSVVETHSDVERQGAIENQYANRSTEFELEALGISVIHGEPFTDRKSTFQAHLAKIKSEEEARLVLANLLEDRKIARATHNIMAYRVFDEEKNIQYQDNDDDGETAAAGRMAEMMQVMGVNNVIVVVSRWYGGIHLGPDRFRHINNCARIILEEQGLSQRLGTKKKGNDTKKKNKR